MILLFQHGPGEPPGYIEKVLGERSVPYCIVRLDETGEIPDTRGISHLVFLGGQMSVHDEKEYPFISAEKHLIRDAWKRSIPVLGICLGAQLIAASLGRVVYPCPEEIGWCGIRKNVTSPSAGWGDDLTVFQWHHEAFELPGGSDLIYTGAAVPNQVFRRGHFTGVQFHPEVTEGIIRGWTGDLPRSARDEIHSGMPRYLEANHHLCRAILESFLWGHAK